ncbi:MAG: FlaA1/EpsC-like NDP-sugar epimerase [Sphingobacteriales bacterium]|jgi:FlaA1/EpsC-like NDP-sugar epimerase
MFQSLLDKYSAKFLSPWLILIIDLVIVSIAFFLSYVISVNFTMASVGLSKWLSWMMFSIPLFAISFIVYGSFKGIVRHTTFVDLYKVFLGISVPTGILVIQNLLYRAYDWEVSAFVLPNAVTVINYFLALFLLSGFRLIVKLVFRSMQRQFTGSQRVLIYGAGELGQITYNTLRQDKLLDYHVVGFVDDNKSLHGKSIQGVKVFSKKAAFERFINSGNVSEMIISIDNIKPAVKSALIDECLDHNVVVKNVPAVSKWIEGRLSYGQIKKVKIDDLLERQSIQIDTKNIIREIEGKVVLVTGAAGSIGSEICRQVMAFGPKKLVLVDQAESPLYDLENSLRNNNPHNIPLICSLADVSKTNRIKSILDNNKPQIIFHAAAYKHVPLMEINPYEAARVNIMGTANMAFLAHLSGVEKFIMVSTDKAVNPTNVMGATKRVAELYTQSLNHKPNNTTAFITTRFGNVLGSNGSVIPLFTKQIENGGPITVTHPDITRYFMTIPEACQLVLEAGSMGKGGEIFIFDMGKSVKILDVARKMINLSGLEVGKDIKIEFSGLRPGEKLYEELLVTTENSLPTHHPKIMKAKFNTEFDFTKISQQIEDIDNNLDNWSEDDIVGKIKSIVPEYKSQNSKFEKLDKISS